MDTTASPSKPILSVQEFMDAGFGEWLERHTFECRIRSALGRAGFQSGRVEHIPTHRLSTVTGRCQADMEFRPLRRIRADLSRAFRREGLKVMPSMITVYKAGSRLLAHVGVFGADT